MKTALEHCDKALQINPLLAEAYLARGNIFYDGKNRQKAKENYYRSIALDQNLASAHHCLGYFYLIAEVDIELAYASFKKAFSLNSELRTGALLLTSVIALNYPEEMQSYTAELLNLAKRQFSLNSHDFVAAHLVAYTSFLFGNHDDAKLWTNITASFDINDRFFLYNLACLYSLQGLIDSSLEAMERNLKIANTQLNFHYVRFVDPDLELVRKDPRFNELLDRYEGK